MPRRLPLTDSPARHARGARRFGRGAVVVISLLTVLGGCSAQDDQSAPDDTAPVRILRPDPEATDQEDIQRRGGLPVVEETDRLEGLIVNPYDMEVGQCFNSYLTALGDNDFQELTTIVDCAGPHDGEVYFQIFHPAEVGEPFLGTEEMEAWAERHCYEQFAGFVGQEYELSELDIGILQPTHVTWSDPIGRHREVTCFVEAWRGGRLLGSMRLSGF